MAVTPEQIEIHIEELVLHGVEPSERAAVVGSLQRELQALVARGGIATLLSTGAAPARVSLDRPAGTAQAGPSSLGAGVARALHQGWK